MHRGRGVAVFLPTRTRVYLEAAFSSAQYTTLYCWLYAGDENGRPV